MLYDKCPLAIRKRGEEVQKLPSCEVALPLTGKKKPLTSNLIIELN